MSVGRIDDNPSLCVARMEKVYAVSSEILNVHGEACKLSRKVEERGMYPFNPLLCILDYIPRKVLHTNIRQRKVFAQVVCSIIVGRVPHFVGAVFWRKVCQLKKFRLGSRMWAICVIRKACPVLWFPEEMLSGMYLIDFVLTGEGAELLDIDDHRATGPALFCWKSC